MQTITPRNSLVIPVFNEQEVPTLDVNPEATFCWSRRRVIYQSGRTIINSIGGGSNGEIQYFHDGIRSVIRGGKNPFGEPCCVMMRSDVFAKTNGFAGEYLVDFRMWLQLWEKGGAVATGKTMSSFRVSSSSWTSKLRGTHANEVAGLLHSLGQSRRRHGFRRGPWKYACENSRKSESTGHSLVFCKKQVIKQCAN